MGVEISQLAVHPVELVGHGLRILVGFAGERRARILQRLGCDQPFQGKPEVEVGGVGDAGRVIAGNLVPGHLNPPGQALDL